MKDIKETNLQSFDFERHILGRAGNLARIPLQLLTLVGLVSKITVKAIFFAPIELIGNGFQLIYKALRNRKFEYLSPTGSQAEGFVKDFQYLNFVKRELAAALEGFIFSPSVEDYYSPFRSLLYSTRISLEMVFTNSVKFS